MNISKEFKTLLKTKFYLSSFIVLIFVFLSFSSLYIDNLPAFLGFALFLFAFLFMDIINFSYRIYFRKIEGFSSQKTLEDFKYFSLLAFISFLFIVIIGGVMNIPLSVYNKQISQLLLLIGLFLIINEFWQIYVELSNLKKIKYGKEINSNISSPIAGAVINLIIHLYLLFSVAIKLSFPNNIIALVLLVLVFGFWIYYGLIKLNESLKE